MGNVFEPQAQQLQTIPSSIIPTIPSSIGSEFALGSSRSDRETEKQRNRERDKLTESHFLSRCQKI